MGGAGMGGAGVSVAHHHLNSGVPKHRSERYKINTALSPTCRPCVAQII